MRNISEDEVLVKVMRRLLADDYDDMYIDIQTGTMSGSVVLDGLVHVSLDEAETLRRVRDK